jgi:O-antigen/teichoic acid export membrane protein
MSAFISRALVVGSSFFLARILGQETFGEYGLLNSTTGMLGSMAGLGLGQTVTKYVAELKGPNPLRAGRILALSSVVTGVSAMLCGCACVWLAPWLATRSLAAPHLAPLLQISAITVTLGVINGVQSASLAGCEAYFQNSVISLVVSVLQIVLVVAGAYHGGLTGAVLATALSMALTVVLTQHVMIRIWRKHSLRYHWQGCLMEWRILFQYSLPTFLILLLMVPVVWLSNVFLVNQPDGYAELAVFNAATQWQGAIQLLAAVSCTALMPVMAEKCGSGRSHESLRLMWNSMRVMAWAAVPLAITLCVAAPWIMRGYGASFAHGAQVMMLLVVAGTVSALMTPVANYVMASGLVWRALLYNVAFSALTVASSWLLVRWGAEGLAVSRLLTVVVHAILVALFVSTLDARSESPGEPPRVRCQ